MPSDRKTPKKTQAIVVESADTDFSAAAGATPTGGKERNAGQASDAEYDEPQKTAEYTPPQGYAAFTAKTRSGHFHESVLDGKEKDKELWLIRLPDKLRLDSLNGVTIKIPSKPTTASDVLTTVESNLHALNHARYSLRQVPSEAAGEMVALEPLIPSARGKVVRSRAGFARYFVLSKEVDFPDAAKAAQDARHRPFEVKRQPEGLKMRFKPYGFDSEPVLDDERAVNEVLEQTPGQVPKGKTSEKKKTKRKRPAEQPEKEDKATPTPSPLKKRKLFRGEAVENKKKKREKDE